MTIIFQMGDNFWIEALELPLIILTDPAGRISSAVINLTRAGTYVGGCIFQRGGPDNDNSQAVGGFDLRDEGGGSILIGDVITGVLWRVNKSIGTDGNTNANAQCILFMRK